MDGEELGFGEIVGIGGRGTEVGQRAANFRDIVPNGQMRDVNFEEKFLVKQILELLSRLHCGTITSLSTKPLNALVIYNISYILIII
jgi:hypothetical protein